MCGEPRSEQVGQTLTLAGWASRRRDHGGLVFVDLRDRTGITQLVINPERAPEAAALAGEIRNEFVLQARGELVARSAETVNDRMPTGEVELAVDELTIVSRSTPLPFQLDEEGVDETLRLRYRWLDLRRDKLQRNLRLRAQMVGIIRRHMEAAGFLDIQTPILFKSTPEGARDFVVPSRLHKGRFFALPQSPQILKQLTMIAGFDRYYQIAICFRDEDLRADRVQEITQLDVELSFPDREELFALMEEMFAADLARVPRHRDPDAVAAHDVRRGRSAIWLRQARHAVRARARGRDRGHARIGVRRLRRTPRPSASFASREPSRAPSSATLEELAKVTRREGARVPHPRRGRARSARRSRSSSPSASSRRCAPAPGETLLFAADDWDYDVERAGPPAPPPRSRARAHRRRRASPSSGSPTSRCSSGTKTRSAGRPSIIRSRVRRTSGETASHDEPARRARVRLRHHRERQRARRWIVPDPRARAAGAGLRPPGADRGRAARRSSGSCSTRSRWARLRTAGSRSGSTA